jgi:uncharacterized GH25 family protein
MKSVVRLLCCAALAMSAGHAHAHKLWLLPSATVLDAGQWITVDAAVSNDLFFFNHVPLRLDALQVIGPDGNPVEVHNPHTGKYRSVFDVELSAAGTYRLAIVNRGLFASWTEAGEQKRWRGDEARFATEVPKDASDLQVTRSAGRIETFVTAGAPNEASLAPSGEGLELEFVSHPNDLFSGETSKFRVLLDGKPAAGVTLELVRGDTRYRNELGEQTLRSDADGLVELSWGEPGRYWLEASVNDDHAQPPATQRRASYVATFEVLPQ